MKHFSVCWEVFLYLGQYSLSRDFGLRHIASVKCCPYNMLMDHGPGPLHVGRGQSKGSTLFPNQSKAIGVAPVGFL